MSRYSLRVMALSTLAVFLVVGLFLYNPFSDSTGVERDSRISKQSPLPKSLIPVVAKTMGKDDSGYHFSSDDNGHTAKTANHGLETSLETSGVTFKSGDYSFELTLNSIGRGNDLTPVQGVSEVISTDNKLEYTRGDVTEWYVNSLLGMEQGFTLSQRPDGGQDHVNILLGLDTKGDLEAKDSEDGKAIIFTDSSGNEVMSYSKLYVYDADKKELESSMSVSEQGILIAYNDTEAKYPVVVDPLVEVDMITSSNGNDDDFFGWCSAVYDKYAVVGAPFKGRGYAYIFERDMAGDWIEEAIFRGQDNGAQSGADFGRSCDIAATEDFAGITAFAVIGAPFDDRGGGSDPGAAYIYERDGSGNWSFAQQIEPSGSFSESFMRFGWDVAITQEGYIVAGAPYENWNGPGICDLDRGAAYYYERNGSWPNTQTQRVTASDSTCFDYFGDAVGLDGVFSIIGAPFWDQSGNDDEGAVYAFERGGTWTQNGSAINPSQVGDGDHFGASVDVYTGTTGTRAIAGAPDANYDGPGFDSNRGEAYILERLLGSWGNDVTRIRSDNPQGFANFGECVGIYGEYAIAGAPNEDIDFDGGGDNDVGAAYVYGMAAVNDWDFEQQLTASDMNNPDRFGWSCDFDDLALMMAYTPVAIVGAPYNNIGSETDQGAAYLFEGEQNGEITIVKETIPGLPDVFSFEGGSTLVGNPCEAFDLSNGDMQECGPLPADTYVITETVTNDSEVVVSCDSGTWMQVDDSVEIALNSGDDITCTFTNTLPLELGPLFPAIKNNVNSMEAANATPNGNVAFIWGFSTGTLTINGPTCNGTELGIKPAELLGTIQADVNGAAEFIFFIPLLSDVSIAYTQVVDIPTCRVSEVVENILTNQ